MKNKENENKLGYHRLSNTQNPDWSEFWGAQFSPLKIFFWKLYEAYRLRTYIRLLKKIDLERKTIIELGGGSGYLLGLISLRKKAIPQVIDNSKEAYEFYKKSGAKLGIKYLKKDMFRHAGKYDVVMSDGLIEHFHKKERVLSIHKKLMKKKGICIIFVPKNSWFVRNICDIFALKIGYEERLFLDELKGEAEKAGLKVIDSISDMHMTGILCRK